LRHLLFSMIGLAGLAVPALLRAADLPVDAGRLLQQQKTLPPPAAPTPGVPVPAGPAALRDDTDDGLRIRVSGFRIEGEDLVFPPAQLLALLAPAQGQVLSLAELRTVVGRITALYRAQGYFLARAVLPPQDVTDGLVAVRVLEGRLDGAPLIRRPDTGPAQHLDVGVAQRILDAALTPGRALRLSELERGLQLLADLPGVSAGGNLEPGRAPDSTRLIVDLQEQPRLHAQGSADNHGSRYTDSDRLGAQLTLDNPAGQGDQLALQLTASPTGDYRYAWLSYAVLASASGLRLAGQVSELNYRVGQELSALDARGSAGVIGVSARHPVLRSRVANLFAHAALDLKRLRNEALGSRTSDKRVDLLTLGITADRSDRSGPGGFSWAELSLSAGTLDLSANAASLAQDQGPQGPRTQGSFGKLNLAATRVQRVGPRLTLAAQVQGQLATRNLDSSEKFLLGGPNGVRAYPGGEAAGDSGVRASVEARWLAGGDPQWGQLQLSAFADAGRIRQWQDSAGLLLTTPNSYTLSGAGVGASLTLPRGIELRAAWAHKLGRNPGRSTGTGFDADGRARDGRAWLSLTISY
jgi:hemolysin activation/secretion protein